MQGSRVAGRVPTPVIVVSGVLLAVAAAMGLWGAWVVGTTWDETNNVGMLQTYFDQGWHVTSDALMNGTPDPRYPFGTYVYGPVGEFLPHAVNVLLGHESWGSLTTSAEAFSGRHVGTTFQALLAVVAAGMTVLVITRSWRWAIVGATALAVTPLWLGHGMFNIKDSPAATGYTIATLGLVALLNPAYFTDRRLRFLALGALVLGAVLAAGVRTALGLPIAAALVMTPLVAWILALRQGTSVAGHYRAFRRFAEGLVALVMAYGILWLIYPNAYSNPINLGIKAVFESALYPVYEAQLTAGTWMTQPVSWTYLPLWFSAQLPLLILFGSVVGLVAWLVGIVKGLSKPSASAFSDVTPQMTPVVLQAMLLPVAAIAFGSTLYNGSRQMLFVVPAVAVLAVIGLWLIFTRADSWLVTRRPAYFIAWIAVLLGLGTPLVAQAALFPYNYTYFNALAALQPIDGRWATDYWRASGRELLTRVPVEGPESCGFEQLQKGRLFSCSQESMFRPYLDERGTSALPGTLGENEYWFIRENSGVLELPPGCRPFDTVTRPLFWQDITIGQIAICDESIDTGVRDLTNPVETTG